MHVLIVGAGPGGLAIAQCLRKQGISFEIFDRDTHDECRFQGFAIAIHSVVEELLAAFPDDMPDLRDATSHLAPLDLPSQMTVRYPYVKNRLGIEDRADRPFIRAERRRLRKWLMTNIPVQWNKHAKEFYHDDDGVAIHFTDGTTAKGDFLIGADGANSKVREHVKQRSNSDLLKVVPTSTIWGHLDLSGEAFRRQLAIAHSAYNTVCTSPPFVTLNGLHHVFPDGRSGRFYWVFMEKDPNAKDPHHWLNSATQQQKLDYVLHASRNLDPRLREAFELTSADGIRQEMHHFKDLELDSLPACRVALVGDAAHAMAPFRGLGVLNVFRDALNVSNVLINLHDSGKADDIKAVTRLMAGYNAEMIARGNDAVQKSRVGYNMLVQTSWLVKPLLKWTPKILERLLKWAVPEMGFLPLANKAVVLPKDGEL